MDTRIVIGVTPFPIGIILHIIGVIHIWVIMIIGAIIPGYGIHPGITAGITPMDIMIRFHIMAGEALVITPLMMNADTIMVPVMGARAIPEEVM